MIEHRTSPDVPQARAHQIPVNDWGGAPAALGRLMMDDGPRALSSAPRVVVSARRAASSDYVTKLQSYSQGRSAPDWWSMDAGCRTVGSGSWTAVLGETFGTPLDALRLWVQPLDDENIVKSSQSISDHTT